MFTMNAIFPLPCSFILSSSQPRTSVNQWCQGAIIWLLIFPNYTIQQIIFGIFTQKCISADWLVSEQIRKISQLFLQASSYWEYVIFSNMEPGFLDPLLRLWSFTKKKKMTYFPCWSWYEESWWVESPKRIS